MTGPRRVAIDEVPVTDALAARLARPPAAAVTLHWLGQAGFVVRAGSRVILVDPYLSDSLEPRYRGTARPHDRLMAPPIDAAAIGRVDLVLCTHHHTDHMDGQSLGPIAARHAGARFVVPAASMDRAHAAIGGMDGRLIAVDAGAILEPLPGIVLHAVRAAHETLETDEAGHHRFLGYGIRTAGLTLFHSGDTIPFDGQQSDVSALAPDLALLPVNGRSEALANAGIAGNLTLDEAIALCTACAIPAMIAHHHGMFAFNTLDPAVIDARAAASTEPVRLIRARIDAEYRIGLA